MHQISKQIKKANPCLIFDLKVHFFVIFLIVYLVLPKVLSAYKIISAFCLCYYYCYYHYRHHHDHDPTGNLRFVFLVFFFTF
jgi:Ca2+/Na+ antiporter